MVIRTGFNRDGRFLWEEAVCGDGGYSFEPQPFGEGLAVEFVESESVGAFVVIDHSLHPRVLVAVDELVETAVLVGVDGELVP